MGGAIYKATKIERFDLHLSSRRKSLKLPSASPPATSAIKIGGRAAAGPSAENALSVSVQEAGCYAKVYK